VTRREGAAAAILDADRRLLLVKENYGRRRCSLPGGAVEAGERRLDTVVRETCSKIDWSRSADELEPRVRM